MKTGRYFGLAWLALFLEKNGFDQLEPEYSVDITDLGFETIHVTRRSRRYRVVDYGGGGPPNLALIEMAIEGVASQIKWEHTSRTQACPRLLQ